MVVRVAVVALGGNGAFRYGRRHSILVCTRSLWHAQPLEHLPSRVCVLECGGEEGRIASFCCPAENAAGGGPVAMYASEAAGTSACHPVRFQPHQGSVGFPGLMGQNSAGTGPWWGNG